MCSLCLRTGGTTTVNSTSKAHIHFYMLRVYMCCPVWGLYTFACQNLVECLQNESLFRTLALPVVMFS